MARWQIPNPWERVYRSRGPVEEVPSPQIVGLVPLLEQEKAKKILDHGCGTGRHVYYLAQRGFHVYGIDSSPTAIAYARKLTNGFGDMVELAVAEMDNVPYQDEFFDANISSKVIHHALKEKREGAVCELKRTLKHNGILFLRTPSTTHPAYGKGKRIESEDNTFINIPKLPAGKGPHHFFTREELSEYFKDDFDILRFDHLTHPPDSFWRYGMHEWAVLARKK